MGFIAYTEHESIHKPIDSKQGFIASTIVKSLLFTVSERYIQKKNLSTRLTPKFFHCYSATTWMEPYWAFSMEDFVIEIIQHCKESDHCWAHAIWCYFEYRKANLAKICSQIRLWSQHWKRWCFLCRLYYISSLTGFSRIRYFVNEQDTGVERGKVGETFM